MTTSIVQPAPSALRPLVGGNSAESLLDGASRRRLGSEVSDRLPGPLGRWDEDHAEAFTSAFETAAEGGPAPPPEWATALHQLSELARSPAPAPSWWKAGMTFYGSIETRTDPTIQYLDGQAREGVAASAISLQLGLAGWGCFQVRGEAPQKVGPGVGCFSLSPSRHSCFLPAESPGWTFARIRIEHPYLRVRLARQVAATGLLLEVRPDEALAASVLRLVRGAIKKDFQDQFEAEIALFKFVLTYERWARQAADGAHEAQRLMDDVRSKIVASLPKAIGVHSLAAEFGMSRSHFSHFFRERTGLTPAHFATEVRIQKAARMLLDTREPLKSIADACGFANANHLCKVFRRFRHLSPASFRRASRC